jgi:uncharacterized protein (TIRG00374 family)
MHTHSTSSEESETPSNQRAWRRAGRWTVSLVIAGICCWLMVHDLDWDALLDNLNAADYHWVLLGVSAIVATFFARTWRWQALLWQQSPPILPTMTALIVGQVVNMALPMRSGDVVRAMWIAPQPQTGAPEALGSIAVEKVWDLVALLSCCILLLILVPLPAWFTRSAWGTALTLFLAGGLLWSGLHWREALFHSIGSLLARLPAGWDRKLLPRLERVADGLESIRRPDVAGRAILWTALNWALGALVNWSILAAFGVPSITAAILLLAALMAGAAVPIPGRLGVFEGICVVSLALFDVPRDQALAVGLVLHAVVMVPPLVAAVILALGAAGSRRRRDEAD